MSQEVLGSEICVVAVGFEGDDIAGQEMASSGDWSREDEHAECNIIKLWTTPCDVI